MTNIQYAKHVPEESKQKSHCVTLKSVRQRAMRQASRETKELAHDAEDSPDEIMSLPRFRKHKFTPAELDVLITEVTKQGDVLFSQGNLLTTREKYRIWFTIAERVSAASGLQRSINDVKRRWQDLKRRTREKVVEVRRNLNLDSPSASTVPADHREDGKPSDLMGTAAVKMEEENTSACSLSTVMFLGESADGPVTSQQSTDVQQATVQELLSQKNSQTHFSTTLDTGPPTPMPLSHQIRYGSEEDLQDEAEPGSSTGLSGNVAPSHGPKVSMFSGRRTVGFPARFASLSPFEQQLLKAHREHTAAIREGFRSLGRQNRLLYLEVCETNKNVARIANCLAAKAEGAADVTEELVRIQHRVGESIDATNNLQERVIDLLVSQQERPVVVLPAAGMDVRPAEGESIGYQSDQGYL
ncbi:myb-related transcription factor, partner of profilin-like isoform X2 [Denticeps clupeoides]|uniref:myb-related transcription factor, partner of profilin-like isoform X2 n=1 Tax=Denticeps clupeoides TaxID=299321 RepID=UPI0010A34C3A|nr:myb-related transcription factor, partner of profilin-like isoform X2 [Denticeps clupeoides]